MTAKLNVNILTENNNKAMARDSSASNADGVQVSLFDSSVENYFKAIDKISELCDEPETDCLDESDIQRFSSSITFLREWRYFNYESRTVRFANETGVGGRKVVLSEINLPQFSSAAVPKNEGSCADATSLESCGFNCSKDFVMYTGGSVWALDWCPRVHERSECHTKCEFIAVAAHPPGSHYHQLGSPLTGRGIIQIWCILDVSLNEEEASPPIKNPKKRHKADDAIEDELKKPRGRPRKNPINEYLDREALTDKSIQLKRPRGRPRKKLRDEPSDNLDVNGQCVQPPTVQYLNDSSELQFIQESHGNTQEHNVQKIIGKKEKHSTERESSMHSSLENPAKSKRLKSKGSGGKNNADICQSSCAKNSSGQDSLQCNNVSGNDSLDISLASCSTPKNIVLPRVILCLAHNGKVAWDVKWQPNNVKVSKCLQRMGYLAVLLGNGSLEVWEVPLPCTMKAIYLSSVNEGTDPRFVKLKPVFRCSMLKCGGIQSIPLTVEWSTSHPHDFLLAGCHDGSVALWKFFARSSAEDTRPLLCFSADTVPIRTVGWAPTESDQESANVIVTAGHGGLKFWDIRDPFRPLWDLHSVPRFIYSLDWSRDPSCVILSFDDGGLRILSLVKTAYDVPATGKPFVGTKHGLHLSNCLPFAVWSVHVSRQTGMVAYCSADGTVNRFQLTARAAEKDSAHNRAPHFMCGYLTEDESAITVNTPILDIPVTTLKKPTNDCGERTMRSLATDSNAVKRANDKKGTGSNSDNQTLPICHDNDGAGESDDDITLEALKSKKESKSVSNSRKKAKDDQTMVCLDKQARNTQGNEMEKLETGDDVEVLPSKMVAVHRVRWNMNKGSERWLCYGGAAGIIRCQEIIGPLPKKERKRT